MCVWYLKRIEQTAQTGLALIFAFILIFICKPLFSFFKLHVPNEAHSWLVLLIASNPCKHFEYSLRVFFCWDFSVFFAIVFNNTKIFKNVLIFVRII